VTGASLPKGDTGTAVRAQPDLIGVDFVGTNPDRKLAPRKAGPQVGTVSDPVRGATYTYESECERTVSTVLGSFPSVLRIEQQVKVSYRLNRKEHVHFMDTRCTYRSGKRIAYFVKAKEESRISSNADAIMDAICARHGTRFADDYRFVSFEGLDPATVVNANLIMRCVDEMDAEALRAVRDILPDLGPEASATEIGEATGLGARGTRAAFALIPTGVLLNPPGEQLLFETPLTNIRSRQPANQAA
jgi:hypothetical protein